MPKSVRDHVQRVLDTIDLKVSVTGRYGQHKLYVLGAASVLMMGNLGWAVSGSKAIDNPIGVAVEANIIPGTGERWYILNNNSDFEWTDIRITMDDHYVLDIGEPVHAGGMTKVFTKDFRYLLYVPRARRFAGSQAIAKNDPPGPTATPKFSPRTMTITTQQGAHTHVVNAPSVSGRQN